MRKLILISAVTLTVTALVFGQTKIGGNARVTGNAQFRNIPQPGGVLVVDGNSLPLGFSMDGQEWGNIAAVLGRRFDASYGSGKVTWYNEAALQTTEDMITRGPTFVDSHYNPGRKNVLVSWEVINDRLFTIGKTVQGAYETLQTYGQARKQAGWYHITTTMSATPWTVTDAQKFQDWENTERFQVDNFLRQSGNGANWDAVADLAANPMTNENVVVHGAQTAHCENFVGCADIHMSKYGSPYVADVLFPMIVSPMMFGYPTSLHTKLKAVFPLWAQTPQVVPSNASDYWGNNHMDLDANSTQQADYITCGPVTGGAHVNDWENHTLHARADGFSVSGWFRPGIDPSSSGEDQWLASKWGFTDGQHEFLVYLPAGSDHVVFKTSDDGTTANSHTVASTVTLASGNWYFFEASYDGTSIAISVNNETPVTAAVPSIKTDAVNASPTDTRFEIGNGNPAVGYTGDLKWFIFATAPLTVDERTYLYNSGTSRAKLF